MPSFSRIPLIYRLVASVSPPLPKKGIEAAYQAIINRLRPYSAKSIADLVLTKMWEPQQDNIETLRSAPWLSMLLVKWALQDKRIGLRTGAQISAEAFDALRQQLWQLQDELHKERSTENVWLMLRSLLHVQIEFQKRETWGFLRWPALYARLDPASVNRRQFREVMGMEPAEYIDLAFSLYGGVLNGSMPLGHDFLSPLRPTYGTAVDRMYELFVRDLSGLREELQRDQAQRIRGAQELQEFPYLRRFPFLRMRNGNLHCWHPLVFARGLEEAVHIRLSVLGKEYIDSFSRVFEQYVTELTVASGMTALTEAEYKKAAGSQASSVEVILEGEQCNIFIEAKMSLFADDVMIQDSELAIFNKLKRVREAVKQGWKVGASIRKESSHYGDRFDVAQDFLLVITSRDLIIGGGSALERLFAPGAFDYPDDEAKRRLPLSNVFILSIEDLENTMGCVEKGEINLSHILRESAAANQDGRSARMFFSDFLATHTQQWSPSALLSEAQDASLERMRASLDSSSLQ